MGAPVGLGQGFPDGPGLVVFFAIGLLGGAHCLGMCGPLVTLYADRMGGGGAGDGSSGGGDPGRPSGFELRQHLLFNLGRTGSYAAIGALLGAVGGLAFDLVAVTTVTAVAGTVRGVVGVLVGGFILVTGGSYALRGSLSFDAAGAVPGLGGVFERALGAIVTRVDAFVGSPRIAALGAVHGFLPCPILYPAYLYALVRGDPLTGALSLGALGIGTVPTLFAYGTVFGTLGTGTREGLHRVLGLCFLVLGYVPLSMGLRTLGVPLPGLMPPFYQPLG